MALWHRSGLWPRREAAASAQEQRLSVGAALHSSVLKPLGKYLTPCRIYTCCSGLKTKWGSHCWAPSGLLNTTAAWRKLQEAAAEVQRPSGAVSCSRCESKKSTFRSLTRYLPICVWVNPGFLGWPGLILSYYKCFLDLILGFILFSIQTQNLFWWKIQSLDSFHLDILCLLDYLDH